MDYDFDTQTIPVKYTKWTWGQFRVAKSRPIQYAAAMLALTLNFTEDVAKEEVQATVELKTVKAERDEYKKKYEELKTIMFNSTPRQQEFVFIEKDWVRAAGEDIKKYMGFKSYSFSHAILRHKKHERKTYRGLDYWKKEGLKEMFRLVVSECTQLESTKINYVLTHPLNKDKDGALKNLHINRSEFPDLFEELPNKSIKPSEQLLQ